MATNTRKLSDFLAEGTGDTFGDLAIVGEPHIKPGTLYPAWEGYLHDTSTAYTVSDTGATTHTITNIGGYHSTLENKIGSTSLSFDGKNAGGTHLIIPDHADWDVGTGDWTFETWGWIDDSQCASHQYLIDWSDGSDRIAIATRASGSGGLWLGTGWSNIDAAWVLPSKTWFHIAIVSQGTTSRVYLDGIQKTTITSVSTDFSGTWTARIGTRYNNADASFWNGYMDQIRFSNTARYPDGTTFTPSTTAFSSDANTKLLIQSAPTGRHSGAFGTAQSDGLKYYYTDIKGSKPIKDPRIGAHFGVRGISLSQYNC